MIITHKEYFECIIPKENRYAFYELIAGQDLFGHILIRRWGRIGTKGHPTLQVRYANEEELLKVLNKVRKERLKKRYKLLSSAKRNKRASKKKKIKNRRVLREKSQGLIQGRLF